MFLHFLKIFFSAKLFLWESFKILVLPTIFLLVVEYPEVIYAGSLSVSASACYGYAKLVTFGTNILKTPIFGGSLTLGTCVKVSTAGFRIIKVGNLKFDHFDKSMYHLPSDFVKNFLTKPAFFRDALNLDGGKSTVFRVIPELYSRYFSPKQELLQEIISYNTKFQRTTNQVDHVVLPCNSVLTKSELQHECETFISFYSNYSYLMRLSRKEIHGFEKESLELAKKLYMASFL